jgi:hypothetical protein
MPQIKDIDIVFGSRYSRNIIPMSEIIPRFGHNIRSLFTADIKDLEIEDLSAIEMNSNLLEFKLYLCNKYNSQQIFGFIFDNFT